MNAVNLFEAVKWAAMQTVTAGGETNELPVGDGCELCFSIGVDVLGFESFQKFTAEYAKGEKEFIDKVQIIRSNWKEAGAAVTWNPASLDEHTQFDVQISKVFRGYSEAAVKKSINCTRLTAKAVAGVPEVRVPSIEKPGQTVLLYLFKREEEYPPWR